MKRWTKGKDNEDGTGLVIARRPQADEAISEIASLSRQGGIARNDDTL